MRVLMIMMMWFVMLSGTTNHAIAQKKLPPFRIALSTGKYFENKDMQRNREVLLIYFSPDCEECRAFTKKLTRVLPKMNNYRVLMVTNTPLIELNRFSKEFMLSKYKNLIIGTEGYTNILTRYLQVKNLPYLAVFDGNQHFKRNLSTAEVLSIDDNLYFKKL